MPSCTVLMESAWMKDISVSRVLPGDFGLCNTSFLHQAVNFQMVRICQSSASCQSSTKQFHEYRHASAQQNRETKWDESCATSQAPGTQDRPRYLVSRGSLVMNSTPVMARKNVAKWPKRPKESFMLHPQETRWWCPCKCKHVLKTWCYLSLSPQPSSN